MKIRRKNLLIVLFVVCCVLIIFLITGYPIVLDYSKDAESERLIAENYKQGDTINPLKAYDFNQGGWTAYLLISKSDKKDLSKDMPKGSILKTTDKILLKEMQSRWKFIYTNTDMATVESDFILYHEGKQVFRSGIVLDESKQGFQNRQYGWLEATTQNMLAEYCKQFDKIYIPIVVLK